MNNSIAMLVIGLFFGGGIGFLTAASGGVTLDGHDHSLHGGASSATVPSRSTDHLSMDHQSGELTVHDELLVLSKSLPQPALAIKISSDPVSGWNLKIATENFSFAPENAGLAHIDGEGHAHVYINGKKTARLYGAWMHIASLPKGDNKIEVSLNSNDHRQLAIGSDPLIAHALVTVH